MARRKYTPIEQLAPGMELGQSVIDQFGHFLISKDAIIDEATIASLKKCNVTGVYIKVDEPNYDNLKEPVVSPIAEQQIEQLYTEDRSKVTLSDSVRERVAQGVQYLYNNTDSSDFADATTSITHDLLNAIDTNDAIAIDINSLKTSDEYTFKHSVDVATISMILAKQQGLSQKKIYEIGVAGLLHDVGKTKIPNEILNKPAKLTDEEFAFMKQHPVFGYQMISERNDFSNEVKLAVLQHHEKINGFGYPLKLTESHITPYAKILTVADIYDALVTERPYKKAFSQRDAVEMIMSMTNELSMSAVRSFLESMILYPVGEIVELSNGEKAKVVKNSPHYILRPTVVGLTSGNVYNLSEDLKCASIIIL